MTDCSGQALEQTLGDNHSSKKEGRMVKRKTIRRGGKRLMRNEWHKGRIGGKKGKDVLKRCAEKSKGASD